MAEYGSCRGLLPESCDCTKFRRKTTAGIGISLVNRWCQSLERKVDCIPDPAIWLGRSQR